jgi:RHS repeat-associated protein
MFYDGMLVLQERHFNPQLSTNNPQQLVTYTRGRDLSSTLEGAGGIGGLLARTDSSGIGNPVSALYHADGNGNVTCLIGTNSVVLARYLYDPYGNLLSQSGSLADANLYRFSSKEWHGASGLVYYGYRFYAPEWQRWVSRDPLGEKGGLNLYRFTRNSPADLLDPSGLGIWSNINLIRSAILSALNRAINRLLNNCGNGLCDEHQGPCNACCAAAAIASFAIIHATIAVGGLACAVLQPPFIAAACALMVGYVYIDQMISLGQAIQACQERCAKLPP